MAFRSRRTPSRDEFGIPYIRADRERRKGAYLVPQGDSKSTHAVADAAKAFGSKVRAVSGKGEFLGTSLETGSDAEQREDARREYERVIRDSEDSGGLGGRDPNPIWRDADHHWLGAAAEEEWVNSAGLVE